MFLLVRKRAKTIIAGAFTAAFGRITRYASNRIVGLVQQLTRPLRDLAQPVGISLE